MVGQYQVVIAMLALQSTLFLSFVNVTSDSLRNRLHSSGSVKASRVAMNDTGTLGRKALTIFFRATNRSLGANLSIRYPPMFGASE